MGKSLTSDLLGTQNETLRSLQERGWDTEDYKAIGTNTDLADELTQVMLRFRLFTPPKAQIQRLLGINEAVWKDTAITPEAISAIGDPPDCPPWDENGLFCVCLFSETGDALKTFARNWDACVHVHGQDGTSKLDGLLLTPEGVRQRVCAITRPIGLRWQVAELGRQFKTQSVANVRPQLDKAPKMGMGQEFPLLAAMHPKWAVSMNGDTVPFVDAPDLEVALGAVGEFSNAPYLGFSRDRRQVYLHARHIGYPNPYFGPGSLR